MLILETEPPIRAAEFGWPAGDQPGELSFAHAVPAEVVAILGATLDPHLPGASRGEWSSLAPVRGVAGRYSLRAKSGSWFVRVTEEWNEPELEWAIADYLVTRGVSVNPIKIAGLPLLVDGLRHRTDVRPLIDGHHFRDCEEELRALAGELGRLHAALRSLPQAGEVRRLAEERFGKIADVADGMRGALERRGWAHFGPDQSWPRAHAEWLRGMSAEFEPRLDKRAGAQCIHMQLHRANVIFRAEDGRPVLIDLEDMVHTFAPVTWDLAYFIQRFCLHDDPTPQAAAARLADVRAAYGSPFGEVAEMMRQTAWFSIAILVRDWNGLRIAAPLAEYEKFVRLEAQARHWAPLLEEFR